MGSVTSRPGGGFFCDDEFMICWCPFVIVMAALRGEIRVRKQWVHPVSGVEKRAGAWIWGFDDQADEFEDSRQRARGTTLWFVANQVCLGYSGSLLETTKLNGHGNDTTAEKYWTGFRNQDGIMSVSRANRTDWENLRHTRTPTSIVSGGPCHAVLLKICWST